VKIALFHNVGPGGAKRAVYEQVRGLVARGHTVDAFLPVTACETYLPLREVASSVRVYGAGNDGVGDALSDAQTTSGGARARGLVKSVLGEAIHDLIRDPFWVRKQRALVRATRAVQSQIARDLIVAGDYDVLFAHQCGVTLTPFLPELIGETIPTVVYLHDTLRRAHEWPAEGAKSPLYDATPQSALRRKRWGKVVSPVLAAWSDEENERANANARRAGLVLTNSFYSREGLLRTMGVNARVCYLGVDAEFYAPDDLKPHRAHEVLSVGSLVAAKRHDFVIEAVATIPEARRPVVRVVGYEPQWGSAALGPVGKSLVEQARAHGVSLTLAREVSDETLRDAYQSAGVFAFAGYLEPFGLVTLEALGCQTPVVAIAEGGARETVTHGVTGLLTDADPAAFGEALGAVLSDPDRQAAMGRAGRADVLARWIWDRAAADLERFLSEATSKI